MDSVFRVTIINLEGVKLVDTQIILTAKIYIHIKNVKNYLILAIGKRIIIINNIANYVVLKILTIVSIVVVFVII